MIDPKILKCDQLIKHLEYGRCQVYDILFDPVSGNFIGVGLVLLDFKNGKNGITIGLNRETGQFEKVEVPVMLENQCELMDYIDPYELRTNNKGDISIWCASCGMESYNLYDVAALYCGRCHKFHITEESEDLNY